MKLRGKLAKENGEILSKS